MYYDSRTYGYSLEYQDRKNAIITEQAKRQEAKRVSIFESREKAIQLENKLNEFKKDVKRSLVVESIFNIMKPTLEFSYQETYAKNLINNFVLEEGAENLLLLFSEKTELLSNISNIITDSYNKIIGDVVPTDLNTFVVKPSTTKDFFDKLDDCNIDSVVSKINKRVCDATEEFVQKNINDKLDMEELAQKTKDKIDKVKNLNKDTEEDIKQELANIYRRDINIIPKKRTRNVYEEMVSQTTKSILQDKDLIKSFINESGSLNMDDIINNNGVMYRLLETVNTTKIKTIYKEYIEKVIKSIR